MHSPSLAQYKQPLARAGPAKPDLRYEASTNLFTVEKGRKLTKRTTIQMRMAIYISANLGMIIWEAS